MVLEESVEEFTQRFAAYATRGYAYPTPLGSPVLELACPVGVLHLFDRSPPPSPNGPVEVIVHGVLERYRYHEDRPGAWRLSGGRYRLRGRIVQPIEPWFYHLDVGIPIVLASEEPLEAGLPLEVVTAPPLMGFRLER
ncbi:hypothetical protein [Marinithermus hydrothermalis]|uniref:Uncharacterized protein n=1 Tax=Marinithermus hydrothermalis (strain DSM 14884 / JCM 11576 / T1) TaxID=869210 RepID=F2NQB0_MARHT|nr:hypothetical protein [Marinithermus hydrothermalis]AEB11637.1 hypothetical protein Marky_0891 [Marinithermus hydrothermalis DSM 14884]